jgi:hypothetical protein
MKWVPLPIGSPLREYLEVDNGSLQHYHRRYPAAERCGWYYEPDPQFFHVNDRIQYQFEVGFADVALIGFSPGLQIHIGSIQEGTNVSKSFLTASAMSFLEG